MWFSSLCSDTPIEESYRQHLGEWLSILTLVSFLIELEEPENKVGMAVSFNFLWWSKHLFSKCFEQILLRNQSTDVHLLRRITNHLFLMSTEVGNLYRILRLCILNRFKQQLIMYEQTIEFVSVHISRTYSLIIIRNIDMDFMHIFTINVFKISKMYE